MNRRDFLLSMASVLGGTACATAARRVPRRPPNIVLILIDDLGWRDVGCYGGEAFETPNVDRLAAQGLRFTQAYANCTVCSPSRAALMTGKNPARLGFTGHITAIGKHRHPEGSRILPPDDKMYVPHEEVTLAEALKPAGYASASVGKWHLGHEGYWPEDQGFDINIGGWTHGSPPSYFHPYTKPNQEWNPSIPTLKGGQPGDYLTDRLTTDAIGFMEDNRDRPFFLYLTHYAVHTPLQAPKDLADKYRRKLDGTGTPIDPAYAAMVDNTDTNVGRVLDALDRLGLTDDTVVVFFSDNGGRQKSASNAPLREGKGWVYEGGLRVPLIIRWPGRVPEGQVCDEPVIGTDLYPTFVELAGPEARAGSPLDGISLTPLWNGADHLDRDTLYWYYPHYHPTAKLPAAAIRKGDFKLVETYDPPNIELFNLTDDLSEQTNLAAAMPDKVNELRAEFEEFLDRVGAIRHTMNPDRQPD
ncbi:MAG: sulfatase [bacterium]|nr:sulfatase [bacterium]